MSSNDFLTGLSVAVLASVCAALIFSVLGVVIYYRLYKPLEIKLLTWKIKRETKRIEEKLGVR